MRVFHRVGTEVSTTHHYYIGKKGENNYRKRGAECPARRIMRRFSAVALVADEGGVILTKKHQSTKFSPERVEPYMASWVSSHFLVVSRQLFWRERLANKGRLGTWY